MPIIARGATDHSRLSQCIPMESNSKVHAYQRDLYSSMRKVQKNHVQRPTLIHMCTHKYKEGQRIVVDMQSLKLSSFNIQETHDLISMNELGLQDHNFLKRPKQDLQYLQGHGMNSTQKNVLNPTDLDVGFIGSSISTAPSNESLDTNTRSFLVQDGGIGSSKAKKKRGRTKGHKLAKTLEHGQRFEVIFSGHVNMPMGKYSTIFTTEIGVLVWQIAPLQSVSWGAVSREKKDCIMDRLRDKFQFSNHPDVISSVECTMARRYNTWRYNLHDKFLKYRTVAAAILNPPVGIKGEDWMYLCNLFTTQKFKAKSEKNKRNKAKLKTTHTAGTKAYSKIRYDKRNTVTQTELEFTELYEFAHQRSDGTWVHENARIFHESLKEHKSKAELEGNILTGEQLSVLTFGIKLGYLCGLGHGPKPASSATGKRTHSELQREAYEAEKRTELAERSAREARQETAALSKKLKKIEDQHAEFSAKLREEMNMHFALFRQQLMEASLV